MLGQMANSQYQQQKLNIKFKDTVSQDLQKSSYLPDFQVSQVIAINQPIDIKCQQQKPFHPFFLRMNDLGYQINHITNQTIILDDNSLFSQSFKNKLMKKNIKNKQFALLNMQGEQGRDFILKQRLQKISEKLCELDYERMQIKDYLLRIKQLFEGEISKYINIWIELLKTQYIKYEIQYNKVGKLQQQLLKHKDYMEQYQQYKNKSSHDQIQLRQKIQQLQSQLNKLNIQFSQLQIQNQQLKYQINKLHQYQSKINNYQKQINTINTIIESNNQYIFDLEQKIANHTLDLQSKQKYLNELHEDNLQQQKQQLQKKYEIQFQNIQQQIKQKVINQLGQQHQSYIIEINSLKTQLQNQQTIFQQQINHLQQEIANLENEKIKLIQQNRNYQIKLHQMQQLQKMAEMSRIEDQHKITQLQMKLRQYQSHERQKEHNYFKTAKPRYIEQSKPQPQYYRNKKSSNIINLEDSILNKSILKQSAISPSSGAHKHGKTRQDLINNILSRIKLRQQGSSISRLNENSFESIDAKKIMTSAIKPHSPQSILLQKQKDARMRNISNKLEQLRLDIRRQIGMKN